MACPGHGAPTHDETPLWVGSAEIQCRDEARPASCSAAILKGHRMTQVFVSYCSEDNYFAGFLIELLEFHYVGVWFDQKNLEAGGEFISEIEQALATCDAMIVVISRHSPKSRCMTREVSHFRAVHPGRPVIPLVLDATANPTRSTRDWG